MSVDTSRRSFVDVRLERDDVRRALAYADARTSRAAANGARPRWGQSPEARRHHDRIGTLAEMAVAVWSGEPWSAVRQAATGDVGRLEVRATTRPNGRLILHDDDKPERAYVLVVVPERPAADGSATLRLVGWYRPEWGLRAGWWREYRAGGGAYYVPHSALARCSTPRLLAEPPEPKNF